MPDLSKLRDLTQPQGAEGGDRRQAKAVEADPGPVRYRTTRLGSTDEQRMRWFILVVAMLSDPATVMLLLAARAD